MISNKWKAGIEVIEDFRRDGYSYFRLPLSVYNRSLSLANLLYALDICDRLSGLATLKSGVLGYYPSEMEAKEMGQATGMEIPTFIGTRKRGYSSFDFIEDSSSFLGKAPLLKNVWFEGCPTFRRRALSLYGTLKTIANKLSCDLVTSFIRLNGYPDIDFHKCLQSDCLSLMRILNYSAEGIALTSKEHTDYEFLTLTIASCEGLEVKSPSGNWKTVSHKKECAIVLPGDMFEVLSNGLIQSSLHRARCGEKERKAVVFFQGLPLDFKIEYSKLGEGAPSTFGEHILSMLIRGSAHLAPQAVSLAKQLNIAVPSSNPFRKGK